MKLLLRPLAAVCVWFVVGLAAAGASNATPGGPVLVLGDSLSAGYGLRTGEGWVALLPQRMAAEGYVRPIVNASVSGETTTGGLGRLPHLMQVHHPAVVVVELGANDALRGLPPADLSARLTRIVGIARAGGAQVLIVGTPLPGNYGAQYSAAIAEAYRTAAHTGRAPLVPSLLDGVVADEAHFQADRLHPTAAAQPRLLDNVWPALKRLLGTIDATAAGRHRE